MLAEYRYRTVRLVRRLSTVCISLYGAASVGLKSQSGRFISIDTASFSIVAQGYETN